MRLGDDDGDPVVRVAEPGDMATVAEIFAHYVLHTDVTFETTPPTPEEWVARHHRISVELGLPFLVAVDPSGPDEPATGQVRQVVGYAYLTPWRPKPAYRHTVEDTVYLAASHTGRGLGRALLEAMLTQAAQAGAHQVIAVIADTGDPASLALHRTTGFAQTGRLHAVGHKHDRWIDTILMQHSLPT